MGIAVVGEALAEAVGGLDGAGEDVVCEGATTVVGIIIMIILFVGGV